MNISEFLSLPKIAASVRQTGDGRWQCLCPAHDDRRTKSLSIAVGDGDKILLNCKAGCQTEAVCRELGIATRDLFGAGNGHHSGNGQPAKAKPARRTYSSSEEAITAGVKVVESRSDRPARFVQAWSYRDDFKIARFDFTDSPADEKIDKTFLPISHNGQGWVLADPPKPLPLYNLTEVQTRPNETVYVCEGEKKCEAGRSINLLTTTSSHGAGSAKHTNWTPLRGRHVVILRDNDDSGLKYAFEVRDILLALGCDVRIVLLPDLPAKGDIYDWLEQREETEPEALRNQICALVEKATPETPSPKPGSAEPVLQCLADVKPVAVDWLWPGRIPMGRITLLVGRPGEGKSFLTTYMASRVSTGSPWPDGADCPSGSVILICAEDGAGDTIRPRLDAHWANVQRIHLLSMVRHVGDDGQPNEVMFTLADLGALEAAIKKVSDCKLLVVDPVGSFVGGRTDTYRDNEVRAVLAPVAVLAEKYGPAVVVVAHRRKGGGDNADDLALGSRAFTGIARVVWHLMRDTESKDRRLLLPGKNNLAPEGDGLAFSIGGEPPAICWEREPVRMSADAALSTSGNETPGATGDAAEFLRGLLADGRVRTTEIQAAAKRERIAWSTVKRAKTKIGVRAARVGMGDAGVWYWQLPETAQTAIEDQGGQA